MARHAYYWADDQQSYPTIVRLVERVGDFFDVRFQDGSTKQVHLHTLGCIRS